MKRFLVLWLILLYFVSGKADLLATYQYTSDQLLPNNGIEVGVVGCGTPSFATLSANFGDCVLNNLGLQPNCSIYESCLKKANGNFNTYESCLVQTPPQQVYAYLNATGSTDTYYYVYIYLDADCTVPLPDDQNPNETFHVQVPFGCFLNQLNSTQGACPFAMTRQSSAAALSFFWDFLF